MVRKCDIFYFQFEKNNGGGDMSKLHMGADWMRLAWFDEGWDWRLKKKKATRISLLILSVWNLFSIILEMF